MSANEHEGEFKVVGNYVFFKETGSDCLGVNHRAGRLEKRQTVDHHLITQVYPFLSHNPATWKKVSILLDGVKKSNIPKLYSPDDVVQIENENYLVYSLLKGKTFERVLEDADQRDNPVGFDLAFSLAFSIADLIEVGSSIVVSGEKSFHGFLTPDNVIIDYDGKIYLKNYGIYAYLNRDEAVFNEMVKKYGAWIAPEFLRKEKLGPQADIYHLGYIIYRILTGKYFSYSTDEDFEARFANISFTQHIPSSDKDTLTSLITFFKKTLHPDPSQRFSGIKEFKDFISHSFHIEELSSVTFSLAYYMNSLYSEEMEKEKEDLEREAAYVVPEKKKEAPAPQPPTGGLREEDILAGFEEGKKARSKLLIPLIVLSVIVGAVWIYTVMSQQKQKEIQAKREVQMRTELEERMKKDMEKMKAEFETEYQRRLKSIEDKTATTTEEKQTQEDEIRKLREWQQAQMRKVQEREKQQEEDRLKREQEEQERKQKEDEAELERQRIEAEKKKEEDRKKKEAEALKQKIAAEEAQKVKAGDLVPLNLVAAKPEKIKDRKFVFSSRHRQAHKGTKVTIGAMLLIDENGSVMSVRVLSLTPEDLRSTVEKTMSKWKYKPAEKDGVKVKVWLPVTMGISF